MTTGERKNDHLRIAIEDDVELLPPTGSLFSELQLIHNALPELNFEEIDTTTTFLGKTIKIPLMIGCMTGGTKEAEAMNHRLAEAAEEAGIAMGLGSQRIMVENPDTASTFQIRNEAPTIPLVANFGAVQLNMGVQAEQIGEVTAKVGADALVFHLNAAQEAVQPEGDTNFSALIGAMEQAISKIDFPCGLKEVGAGFSIRDLKGVSALPISFLESAGKGGTSWTAIEAARCQSEGDRKIGQLFADWGIPSPVSLQTCVRYGSGIPVIASGGIRSGLDGAKCIAMGASMTAMALPMLKAAQISTTAVLNEIRHFERALKTAMFLSGCTNIDELKKAPIHIPANLTPEVYEGHEKSPEE